MNEESQKPMHIVRLTAQNTLNMSAIDVELNNGTVIISGKNGAGKSNFLKAIEFALDGKVLSKTVEPVKRGETSGKVVLDLGDITVTRSFTNERSSLQISNSEGMVFKSPQAMLDKFRGHIGFDPLEFANLDAKQQKETLLKLCDIPVDLDEMDLKRKTIFDQRTHLNRQIKSLNAQKDAIPSHPDLPDVEEDSTELMTKYQTAMTLQNEDTNAQRAIESMEQAIKQKHEKIQLMQSQMDSIAKEIVDLGSRRAETELHRRNNVPPDPELFKLKLASIQETNRMIREKQTCNKLIGDILELTKQAGIATDELKLIDETKTNVMENANMPVPGLGFDETGITFEGLPLSQRSDGEKIRISVGIGMAINPTLKTLWITDASLLDDDSIAEVSKMAAEHGYQLFLEKVDGSGNMGIYIEDGEIKKVN
ncbi:MAG: AAA family ATPase [bacterium]